ncbi:MAG: EAL domain-containing protein [Chloroflexota bacterium]
MSEKTLVLYVGEEESVFVSLRNMIFSASEANPMLKNTIIDWYKPAENIYEQLCSDEYHAYLLDYHLNEGNSMSTLVKIVTEGHLQPIIMLTNQDGQEVEAAILEAGASDYLDKSNLTPQLLERSLRYAIKQKKTEKALRQSREYLVSVALYDSLTGLANRYLLETHLQEIIEQAKDQQTLIGIIAIDLYRFKDINDTLGHAIGDQLLMALAKRLEQNFSHARQDFTPSLVARLGGDEFALVIKGIKDLPALPAHMALKPITDAIRDLLADIHAPFRVGEHELFIGAHVGYCLYPYDGEEISTLLGNTENALDAAKTSGIVRRFNADMNMKSVERLKLTNRLRQAPEKKELALFYQPQIDLVRQRVIGIEALIRWFHPNLGIVPPDQFIPLAEKSGIINMIGDWVIEEALTQFSQWVNMFGLDQMEKKSPFRISINVSPVQFAQSDFIERLIRPLARSGLDPHFLTIEVTESVFMHDIQETDRRLRQLHDMGLEVHVDDFGKAYSSLSYLRSLPVDCIKIDKTFIDDLKATPLVAHILEEKNIQADPNALVNAIITLGHSLKVKVLAEGVETQEQRDILCAMGCDHAQGYYYAKPVPANEVWDTIRSIEQRLMKDQPVSV